MDLANKPRPSVSKSNASSDGISISALPSPVKGLEDRQIGREEKSIALPPKLQFRTLRHARLTFFNVYRRIFTIVFVLNVLWLIIMLKRNCEWLKKAPFADLATGASANLTLTILVRQDYVINGMFKLCWLVPLSTPLRIRRMIAKTYQFGGMHSGAAVCAVFWFALLTGFLTSKFISGKVRDPPVLTISYVCLTFFVALIITAYPRARFTAHNTFENVHRWGGWFALLLFWVEILLFVRCQLPFGTKSFSHLLVRTPAFYFLLVSTGHVILPWLRFRKLPVRAEQLSSHAVRLHFTTPVPLFVGLRISDAPLREWHSFACIPSRDGGRSGGSLLVSDAGDWTSKTVTSPREYYYIKGIPVTGVLCMAQIFRKVIIVTTGSGIGPCLGVVQDVPRTACRVIWSTPSPLQTYGAEICGMVKEVDPKAMIIDTRVDGRPDLVMLAYALYKEEQAEAVFVISNPKLTRKVVYGMESRGVPAFGPIWDS